MPNDAFDEARCVRVALLRYAGESVCDLVSDRGNREQTGAAGGGRRSDLLQKRSFHHAKTGIHCILARPPGEVHIGIQGERLHLTAGTDGSRSGGRDRPHRGHPQLHRTEPQSPCHRADHDLVPVALLEGWNLDAADRGGSLEDDVLAGEQTEVKAYGLPARARRTRGIGSACACYRYDPQRGRVMWDLPQHQEHPPVMGT